MNDQLKIAILNDDLYTVKKYNYIPNNDIEKINYLDIVVKYGSFNMIKIFLEMNLYIESKCIMFILACKYNKLDMMKYIFTQYIETFFIKNHVELKYNSTFIFNEFIIDKFKKNFIINELTELNLDLLHYTFNHKNLDMLLYLKNISIYRNQCFENLCNNCKCSINPRSRICDCKKINIGWKSLKIDKYIFQNKNMIEYEQQIRLKKYKNNYDTKFIEYLLYNNYIIINHDILIDIFYSFNLKIIIIFMEYFFINIKDYIFLEKLRINCYNQFIKDTYCYSKIYNIVGDKYYKFFFNILDHYILLLKEISEYKIKHKENFYYILEELKCKPELGITYNSCLKEWKKLI